MRVKNRVDELIRFGEHHLLWKWRAPWLLHWRRGIRGLEYGTLAACVRAMATEVEACPGGDAEHDPWIDPSWKLERDVDEFCSLARRLLLEEKLATQTGRLTKLGKVSPAVDTLRERLFGSQMSHSGLCRAIFDDLDRLLLGLFRIARRPGRIMPAGKPSTSCWWSSL